MCKYEGDMCMHVPNMKFVYLHLYLVEVCTDANADANTNDANTDTRRTKHDCIRLWLINQMSQKEYMQIVN